MIIFVIVIAIIFVFTQNIGIGECSDRSAPASPSSDSGHRARVHLWRSSPTLESYPSVNLPIGKTFRLLMDIDDVEMMTYTIIEKLTFGTQGIIYKAKRQSTLRPMPIAELETEFVAIKRIPFTSKTKIMNFHQEIIANDAVRGIDCVPAMYAHSSTDVHDPIDTDVHDDDGSSAYYRFGIIIMEYIHSEDVFSFVVRRRDAKEKENAKAVKPSANYSVANANAKYHAKAKENNVFVLDILQKTLRSAMTVLMRLHQHNITYYDMKMENLLLHKGTGSTSQTDVFVCDFGLCNSDPSSLGGSWGTMNAKLFTMQKKQRLATVTANPTFVDGYSLSVTLLQMFGALCDVPEETQTTQTRTEARICGILQSFVTTKAYFETQRIADSEQSTAEWFLKFRKSMVALHEERRLLLVRLLDALDEGKRTLQSQSQSVDVEGDVDDSLFVYEIEMFQFLIRMFYNDFSSWNEIERSIPLPRRAQYNRDSDRGRQRD